MDDTFEQQRLDQFVAQFAYGVPVPQALISAGYDIHTVSFGYSLLKSPEAQLILDTTREWIKTKLTASLESVVQQLDRDREFAYECEQPGAAVTATMNKAKLLGFMDEKKVPAKITIEWGDQYE
jgi:hypothetical protein